MHALRSFAREMLIASSKGCSIGQHCSSSTKTTFNMKHALVVSKLSRYEYEQYRNPNLSEEQLEALLRKRGSDFDTIIKHHHLHKEFERKIQNALINNGIETQVVNRFTYTEKSIEWADVIIAAGGDGTFLLAASRITGSTKPLIGFNSDPGRSEGHLCLPKKYSANYLEAIEKLKKGEFSWQFRSRIRISLCGNNVHFPPVELHEQDSLKPHHRYYDNITEQQKSGAATSPDLNVRILPVLALNEVFIGENLSARVSFFELSINGGRRSQVKSSGLCVCTGTGSTSWHLSINRITHQSVAEIARLLGKSCDDHEVQQITKSFNDCLVFSPAEEKRMCYTIRDLISTGVWPNPKGIEPRGYASSIEVQSRCFDAGLVIDGGLSFHFNDGAMAVLEIHDSDALRTVALAE